MGGWANGGSRGELVPRGAETIGPALDLPPEVANLLLEAGESLTRRLSRRTRIEYDKALRHYYRWAEGIGITSPFPLSLAVVLAYVQGQRPALEARTLTLSTVRLRLAAMAHEQARLGEAPVTAAPEVVGLLRVLRREVGRAVQPKDPLLLDQLNGLGALWADRELTNRQSQGRAVILLGFALAVRRSNLVALNVSDLRFEERGVVAFLVRSKTDQEARGTELAAERVGGPLCPVAAVEDWVRRLPLDADGPLFRGVGSGDVVGTERLSERAVARIVKRAAAATGCDETRFAAHSLRSGYATEAALAGWDAATIAFQTQHASLDALRKYIRRANLYQHNAGGQLLRRAEG